MPRLTMPAICLALPLFIPQPLEKIVSSWTLTNAANYFSYWLLLQEYSRLNYSHNVGPSYPCACMDLRVKVTLCDPVATEGLLIVRQIH